MAATPSAAQLLSRMALILALIKRLTPPILMR